MVYQMFNRSYYILIPKITQLPAAYQWVRGSNGSQRGTLWHSADLSNFRLQHHDYVASRHTCLTQVMSLCEEQSHQHVKVRAV